MARDADSIALWLIDNGFKGIRRSQYGKSAHPPTANKYELQEIILDYKDKLKCPPGVQCCHELFIYINAHGAAEGFEIHDRTGKSSPSNPFYDDDLVKVLKELPDCVKLTIFLDVCYSGGAIKWFKPLCEKFGKCGVTIITACDADSETLAGVNIDSATEDFMEGASKDNDGDGDKGDIRDRLLEMQNELGNSNPQLWMCDGQTRMCSLEKLPGILPKTPQGVFWPWHKIPEAPPKPGPLVGTVQVREEEKKEPAERLSCEDATALVEKGLLDMEVTGTGTTTGLVFNLINKTNEHLCVIIPTGTLVTTTSEGYQPYQTGYNPPYSLGAWGNSEEGDRCLLCR